MVSVRERLLIATTRQTVLNTLTKQVGQFEAFSEILWIKCFLKYPLKLDYPLGVWLILHVGASQLLMF